VLNASTKGEKVAESTEKSLVAKYSKRELDAARKRQ